MGAKLLLVLLVLCLAGHVTVASIFEPDYLGCKCLSVASKVINRRQYTKVEIHPSHLACSKVEIIITLKNGTKVCVNPQATWVKRLLEMLQRRIERGY